MLKSNYIDLFFETKNEKYAFDAWFDSIDWNGTSAEEIIEKVDDFLNDGQYEDYYEEDDDPLFIEDYTFGKNGNEEEYINSVKEYVSTHRGVNNEA